MSDEAGRGLRHRARAGAVTNLGLRGRRRRFRGLGRQQGRLSQIELFGFAFQIRQGGEVGDHIALFDHATANEPGADAVVVLEFIR
jgi:hypothetical protein